MGQKYEHLSREERVEIYRWNTAGKSAHWIGEALGRHHSVISRELQRNSKATKHWPGGYEPLRADDLAQRRRKRQGRFKLARQPRLRRFVRDKLAMGWSPEAIAFRSAQCDYWHRLLPQKKHRRGWLGKRGGSPVDHIRDRVSIAERPAYILKRRQPGHWETDIIGFSRTGQNLLVAQERSSRFIFIAKTASRQAAVIHRLLRSWFKALPGGLRRSLTQDNGTEFALHHRLRKPLAIKTYFCDPHSPWQKGGIENMNGRLRRSLPRSTDLTTISHRQIRVIARRNNSIPRKCLGFRTSFEVFNAFS
jgi:IS30 family transposase